jgi:hypothetical protein
MLTSSKEIINELSEGLIADLQKKYDTLPDKLKYKFDIARRNPDPQKTGGDVVYNSYWVLQPVTFNIVDPYDKKDKKIGLVDSYDNEQRPTGYKRIVLVERDRGIKTLNKIDPGTFDTFCYLELHPSNGSGKFKDVRLPALFELVNEAKDAKNRDAVRKVKADAMYVANNLSTQEEKDFAAAMNWDEDMDADVLHDMIGSFAEETPEAFKNFFEGHDMQGKALVKRAENNQIIDWVPTEYKYVWSSTKDLIVAFGRQEGMNRLEQMSNWLQNKPVVHDKIKALLKTSGVKS